MNIPYKGKNIILEGHGFPLQANDQMKKFMGAVGHNVTESKRVPGSGNRYETTFWLDASDR